MKYEMVVFDMDGTLVREGSCWEVVHKHFGVMEEARENLESWKNGKISYEEFMRRDIELWKPTPHISDIKEILSDFQYPPKAPEVMEEIKNRGYRTAIISGGIDVLAEMVAQELSIDHVYANGIEIDEAGYLTGEGVERVDPDNKRKVLSALTEELDIDPDHVVSVGDSVYDTDLFEYSGMGIAIGDDGSATNLADATIENFEDFEKILDYL